MSRGSKKPVKSSKNKNTVPDSQAVKNSAFSARSGARTLDTLIKSQVLYQLS